MAPDGWIAALSDSVPGGANHDLTVRRGPSVLERWDRAADEGASMDQASGGIAQDHPEIPWFLPHQATRNHPLTEEPKAYNRLVARYRIVVEHTMAPLNRFGVLRQVFQSLWQKPSRGIRVVAMIVDRRIRVVPLKTSAAA